MENLKETRTGTWVDKNGIYEYSADGFELIHIYVDDSLDNYEVVEGVRSINLEFIPEVINSITLPSTLVEIKNILCLSFCKEVKNNSPYFLLENGCLYTVDKSELIFVFNELNKGDGFIFDEVQKIRNYAFLFNVELQNITIPYGVEVIREGTFAYNFKLIEINLPDTVVSIEHYAFYHCGLESIILPESLKQIHRDAFEGCDKIKSVTVNSPHFIFENGILYDSKKTEIIIEFEQMIGSEVTIPETLSRISISSALLDYYEGRRITISRSSPVLEEFKRVYGSTLNIID